MYVHIITSSAGLTEQADTPQLAAAVLRAHLAAEIPPAGSLHWHITSPRGPVCGHVNLNGRLEGTQMMIDDIVEEVLTELNASDTPERCPGGVTQADSDDER